MIHAIIAVIDNSKERVLEPILIYRFVGIIVKVDVVSKMDDEVSTEAGYSSVSNLHVVQRFALLKPPENLSGYILVVWILWIVYVYHNVGTIHKSVYETLYFGRQIIIVSSGKTRIYIAQALR